MSKDSKQTSTSQTAQLPNAPDYIKNGLEGLSGAIINLGQRNPQSYVPGASNLQNAAFSMGGGLANRYGANVNPQNMSGIDRRIDGHSMIAGGQQMPQGGGDSSLFGQLGVKQPEGPLDYNAIFNQRPHLQDAYNGLTPKDRRDIATVMGIPAGNINAAQFAEFHMNNHPQSEDSIARARAISSPAQPSGGNPAQSNPGRDIYLGSQPQAMMGMADPGYSAATLPGQNPLDMYGDAADIARQVSTAGANQVSDAATYNPAMAGRTTVQSLPGYDAANSGAVNLGPMAQADAAQVGNMQGYGAAQAQSGLIGAMQGYDPALIDGERAYDAAMNAANNISGGRVSAQSLLTNLDDYMNPYTEDVVDTTLAGFDENAGRIEAQQQAQAAQNGAFGGSRYGVLEAITQGELARERAGTEAGLRSDAFNTGAGLSADDANRRQSASATNAQIQTQEALARQQAEIRRAEMMFAGAQGDQNARNQAGAFLADAQNSRSQLQGQFDQQTNLANADSSNTARQFGANANNNAALTQAGFNQDASLSNRDAMNQGLLAQLDADLTRSLADQSAQNTASQFGAAQTGQQYLTQAGLDQESMLSNQSAANRASEFNASTINDLNRFNASQADTALDRALRGADSLRTTGSTQEANERAAIDLLSRLGGEERGIQQQQQGADIALLSTIAQLFGGLPFDQVTGVTGSQRGTQTTTPGLLDYLNTASGLMQGAGSAMSGYGAMMPPVT
jgi:hypothetical protein